jgi:CxxC motif-containing protein
MSFEQQIQQWVSIDNQIKLLNEKAKVLRDNKNKLSENILSYVETQNLHSSTVEISDGKLKFANTKTQQPITFKYLETCLKEIIKNEDQVNKILNYIKEKREVKQGFEIKRLYNN